MADNVSVKKGGRRQSRSSRSSISKSSASSSGSAKSKKSQPLSTGKAPASNKEFAQTDQMTRTAPMSSSSKEVDRRMSSRVSLGEQQNDSTKEDRQPRSWSKQFPDPEPRQVVEVTANMSMKKKILLLALTLFLLGCAVLIILWYSFYHTVGYCETDGCLGMVRELKSAMDRDVSACDNFYMHTCGSWKPEGNESSMIGRIFARSTNMAIREMEGNSAEAVIPKASEFYKSCVRVRDVTHAELNTFISFKQDLGFMWPEKQQVAQDALFVLLRMTISWGIHMLFNLRAFPAYRERPQTLYIRRGMLKTAWLGKDWSSPTFVMDVKKYCGILGAVEPTDGYDELKRTVEDIVNSALSIPVDATSDTQFKLKEMELLMPNRTQHWLLYLNDLHKPQFRWDINSPVALEDDAILVAIDTLQKLYAAKTELLMEGFSFVFVRTYLWALIGKPELIYGDDTKLGRHMLKITCLHYTSSNFGLLIAANHIHERYDTSMREKLSQFYHTIQSQVKEELSKTHWMDSVTRAQAFIKLDKLSLNAMPDQEFFSRINLARLYRDFPPIGSSFVKNFIDVAAAYRLLIGHDNFIGIFAKRLGGGAPVRYNYYYNIAFLSLGVMEPPMLYKDGTLAMKYGSLGTHIAECAVRTFDRVGVTVNDKGRPEHWWDTPAYVERTSCDLLAGTASGTPPDQRPGGRDPREVLHTALFPLAPALTTSFNAYRKALVTLKVEDKVDELRLRGMDEFSDDQVFFLSYCLMTCASKSSGEACNVPLRHMPQFAATYGCPEGSAMNPAKKCLFFG